MTGGVPSDPTTAGARRWAEVLALMVAAVPAGPATVLVDSLDDQGGAVADRLAAALLADGRPCVRHTGDTPPDAARLVDAAPLVDAAQIADGVTVADGPQHRERPPAGGWTMVVWLRTASSGRSGRAEHRGDDADVVLDLHDPGWPVLRHIDARLADRDLWYLTESRAFFGARAATWDARFGDDRPAYDAAVADSGLAAGGVVVDVGCGTGRALPALRTAVGPAGTVIGLDVTPQMLDVAQQGNAATATGLVLADARRLPFADGTVDGIFAAGLMMHLPDIGSGLLELARVTRPGGRLVLFHPTGRAALAGRHGRAVRPDEPLNEEPLRGSAAGTGWRLTTYDDAPHRFLAVAVRAQP